MFLRAFSWQKKRFLKATCLVGVLLVSENIGRRDEDGGLAFDHLVSLGSDADREGCEVTVGNADTASGG